MKLLEKVKNTKNKKKVAAAIIAMAIVLTAGTIALLSQVTQAANNNFKGAVVNVGVVENGTNKTLEDSINSQNTNTYATMDTTNGIEKEVAIKNINSTEYPTTDTYVRVRLVPKLVWNDNTEYAGQTACANLTSANVTYGFVPGTDSAQWMAATDSTNGETYYYYTKALAPDETSTQLISHVTYSGEIPQNQHFELEVLTEGIAASQHTTTDNQGNVTSGDYASAWKDVTGPDIGTPSATVPATVTP